MPNIKTEIETVKSQKQVIPYDERGHKCFCGEWLCETPERLECTDCEEKREKKGIIGKPIMAMGSMLKMTKCKNCEGLIYKEFTPNSSV